MEKAQKNTRSWRFPDRQLLLAISLLAIFGAAVYYLDSLDKRGVILSLGLSLVSYIALYPRIFRQKEAEGADTSGQQTRTGRLLTAGYLLAAGSAFALLVSGRSDQALISPWQTVKPIFFLAYTAASLLLFLYLSRKKAGRATGRLLLSIHYFLSFGVAAIVYKIGYGFDPFIHQATMELIDKKGAVDPKPLYYLGEYALIVIAHKLSGISIALLDKFLVPVLAAVFLPAAFGRLDGHYGHNRQPLVPFFVLAAGFAPFILTTPQNLSYLFLVLTITAGLTESGLAWPLVLSLATVAIHPLTGIPAFGWWLLLAYRRYKDYLKPGTRNFFRIALPAANTLTLPAALFLAGGGFRSFDFSFSSIFSPLTALFSGISAAGEEGWLLNLVYLYAFNYRLWLTLALTAGLVFFYKRQRAQASDLLSISLSLAGAYLISSQISFSELISYEQGNFAARIVTLIAIFLIPGLLYGLRALIGRITAAEKPVRIIWIGTGLALVSLSLYVSYPRFDKHFSSRGYSTGAADIAAVLDIEKKATQDYIVLANQQVSAAALRELGFDHYYPTADGPAFFYPIPTGGRLYQYYLDMVYEEPSRKTMEKAMAYAGVRDSYLALDKYWKDSAKIIAAAKLDADSWRSIDGQVYIFEYRSR